MCHDTGSGETLTDRNHTAAWRNLDEHFLAGESAIGPFDLLVGTPHRASTESRQHNQNEQSPFHRVLLSK